MEVNDDVAAALVKAVSLLLDRFAPADERARLARDLNRVFREYEEWAMMRQRERADEARRLRKRSEL